MLVREAMSSPVLTISENKKVTKVAQMMRDGKVGAIIIVNDDGLPVGIVTERDIVNRVVAEGISPEKITVKDVMSAPLKMVDPEMTLIDAMTLMDRMKIRRLGVKYKEQLVGLISSRDIIRLIPTIVEIIKEYREINNNLFYGPSTVGYCYRCEGYSPNLRQINGEFICEDCRIEE
jgi:signal-transduction protein with cAMP-binding, CBS, and nucleotidyltransferase domain